MEDLSASAQKVQSALQNAGVFVRVKEMPATTRTAKEAAEAIGCTVAQIAKSLVFRTGGGRPVMVVASGVNRVNEKSFASMIGDSIERASPDFVRETTGFVIGGVPPVAHATPIEVWFDQDLLKFETVWAAAGTPFAVFEIKPAELLRVTAAKSVQL